MPALIDIKTLYFLITRKIFCTTAIRSPLPARENNWNRKKCKMNLKSQHIRHIKKLLGIWNIYVSYFFFIFSSLFTYFYSVFLVSFFFLNLNTFSINWVKKKKKSLAIIQLYNFKLNDLFALLKEISKF